MYPVSDAFMEAIEKNARKYHWTGTIVTKNKRTYTFGNEDILKGSGYISRQCCGSTEIELGTVYASELGITLFSDIDRYTLEEAEIRIWFHLVLPDGTEETVPMGVFEVSEANRAVKCLELKAYDYMLRFDKSLQLNSSSGTAYSFLVMACSECGVELAQTKAEIEAMPNGKETLGIYSDNDMESYRDLLYYVAQVLGGVCQIDREGRLEILAYGADPVATVQSRHRYDSSYSDFVTRYTAVSSTNMITEEAEYYALEPDDGLTLNLGVNPLLQFGLKSTRERLIRNILNSIAVVSYVPFDSTTIGNPALDPMDVLRFCGGHADEKQVSAITGITYKINGKHTLKCVGKNPKLAGAKSKTDKNITGLLNQVEAGKTVVYNFTNAVGFTIRDTATEIMAIDFTSKEETTATFLAEILFEARNDTVSRTIEGTVTDLDEGGRQITKAVELNYDEAGESELTVIYKMNNDEIETFYPKKTCINGKHILTLFLPITQVIANSGNTFSVCLKMRGGILTIGQAQIRATISGQGLVAGLGDWNGRIGVSDVFEDFTIEEPPFKVDAMTDHAVVGLPYNHAPGILQRLGRVAIPTASFSYKPLNERVSAVEEIKAFTMDADFPPDYDQTVVEVDEGRAFRMINDYVFVSECAEINLGLLQELKINTTPFEQLDSMEVEMC